MARQIADLAVKISASATAFEAVLGGAEKRLTQFAAKAASPVGYASKISSLAAGAIAGPVGIAASAAGTIAQVLSPSTAHLLNPAQFSEAMDNVVNRTVELAREAKRLDFEPAFLRGMRLAAGADAEAAEKAVGKLMRLIGEANRGGAMSELGGGNQKAADKLRRWGLDPEALGKMTNADRLRAVADRYKELGSATDQAAYSFDLMSKSGFQAGSLLSKGSEGIDKWVDKVKEAGVVSSEMIAVAQAMKIKEKEWGLTKEAAEANAFMKYGALGKEGAHERHTHGMNTKEYWVGLSKEIVATGRHIDDVAGFDLTGALNPAVVGPGFSTKNITANVIKEAKAAAEEHAKWMETDAGKTAVANMALGDYIEKLEASAKSADKVATLREMLDDTDASPAMVARGEKALGELIAKGASDHAKAVEDAARKTNLELEIQIDTFGMTAAAAANYRDELDMLPDSLQGVRGELVGTLEAMKEGKQVFDETRNPIEQYQKQLEKLEGLLNFGEISEGTYSRAVAKASKSLMGSAGDSNYRIAAAATYGSAEDARLTNANIMEQRNAGRDPTEKMQDALERIKAAVERDAQEAALFRKFAEENGMAVFPAR